MNAAETIAAAIEKLEAQREASTPGPWIAYDMSDDDFNSENNKGWWWVWQESALPFYGGVMEIDHHDNFGRGGTPIGAASRTDTRDGEKERADADLIVTLHRTIDAQLAILRYAGALASNFSATFGEHPNERQALDLARAILGEVA